MRAINKKVGNMPKKIIATIMPVGTEIKLEHPSLGDSQNDGEENHS